MFLRQKFRRTLKRFGKDESANPTVEFVMLFPMVMWIVFSAFESGWLLTQHTMLTHGITMAVRDLRIGVDPSPDHASIKTSICDYAAILRDCDTALHLELVELDNAVSSAAATCVDRASEIEPVVSFIIGSRIVPEIMVLRACFVVDPIVPGAGIGSFLSTDATGGFHMVAYSAFVNEPH